MTAILTNSIEFLMKTAPWWLLTGCSFAICYLLVPVCRKLAISFGMVDMPSARRINKSPIPRSGGLAIFLAVSITFWGYITVTGNQISPTFSNAAMMKMSFLSAVLVVVGLLDDKFGLPPIVKLGGQLVVALGSFWWGGLGFSSISFLNWMPQWLDCALTVFWIVGAINAFNLIDGLDGLATGLALIATIGMGGALFFIGRPECTLVYFIFAAACLAFLRYNFNPASVFLGDTGSMYIGFVLATLPLATKTGDSLFVSIGVPILAMGVPIFDTSLAIIRRSLRRFIKHEESNGSDPGNSKVMQADTDHLHHRILRRFVNQRKAAGALYALAGFFVLIGIAGIALRDRASGFFIIAFIVAVVIIVRDMRRIELYDAGRLLNTLAHDTQHSKRTRRKMLAVPFYVAADCVLLAVGCIFCAIALGAKINGYLLHTALPIRVISVFFCLCVFRTYNTLWSRAQLSNYARIVASVFLGTMVGSAGIIYLNYPHKNLIGYSVIYFLMSVFLLVSLRVLRPFVRDLFYAIDHGRLADSSGTSRILVYGSGLRYNMFRRELVRKTSKCNRIIVGIIDDDALLRGLYIGGRKIYGTLHDAPQVIRDLRIDSVVIACEMQPSRLEYAKKVFDEAGVKVTLWSCEEKEV